MANIDADRMMRQAAMTANDWGIKAKRFVDEWFDDYPPSARATIIAAYMNAAAGDEIAIGLVNVAETLVDINTTLVTMTLTEE